MLTVNDVSLHFSDRKLYDNVNIAFTPGNCYGIIGANGAGKSTFLNILSGKIAPSSGNVSKDPDERLSVLSQDHFGFEDYSVMDTVIMGNRRLYEIKNEKDAIYAKESFTEEDGIKAGELEAEFAELNGWEAESEAAQLLKGLDITEELHYAKMSELREKDKVKVLLAQALFGNPDILLLDEPTNGLDSQAIEWLAEYLIDFPNTVIVVSHDRYFLNKVCTHICDVDFGKIQLYVGNYDFWKQSSELAAKLQADANAKKEEKIKELQDFIARFSANASKSKQATSRKKMLDKIELDDIRPSSRKYPYVGFDADREIGNDVLTVENLSKTIDGVKVLDNITFTIRPHEKVAFLSRNDIATTTLFKIITGELEADSGSYKWGVTTSQAYLARDNSAEFQDSNLSILEWLRQYAPPEEQDNTFLRSFLGRMLFTGEDVNKNVSVLSGGEKVRCMLSKMMLSGANVLILDDPTNHLDLESISSLNDGLIKFKEVVLFSSHDREFIDTIANRIIHVSPNGLVDRMETTYSNYLNDNDVQKRVANLYIN
ncbi:ABC-F family ATP-binding cassette domain-containing protein [Aerococcus kribbianus]|uniref:ATP-binding cassette domain-containing protein n=1 Tax=Aerococcus kribbianus TaxID=2999064 RepID=A0A9X3FLS2_9LACT|nr:MULTISPECIES: ATP-binding cassette domain-containing protein [unclassified Aerococcus]MCZ0716725.1 ATP-binding cassette domain-containing protein [Aerococcus sp. YH-aer221]MCZ0725013.1 ATP-binding cassette domain-containing protein [Aerococcus sp. YH-aer222]